MTTLIPKFDFKDGGATPTGAVNRPINEKLSEVISVLDFGADATGATDSTTAIQNAVTYAAGAPVYFPTGTYVISSTITWATTAQFAPALKIYGDGAGKTNIDNRVANGSCFVSKSTTSGNFQLEGYVRDLKIYTTTNPVVSNGIEIQAVYNFEHTGLHIIGMTNDGMRITCALGDNDAANQILYSNCRIENCKIGINSNYSAGIVQPSFITVRKCFFQGHTTAGWKYAGANGVSDTNAFAAMDCVGLWIWFNGTNNPQFTSIATTFENCGNSTHPSLLIDSLNSGHFINTEIASTVVIGTAPVLGVQMNYASGGANQNTVVFDTTYVRIGSSFTPYTMFNLGTNAFECRIINTQWQSYDAAGQVRYVDTGYSNIVSNAFVQVVQGTIAGGSLTVANGTTNNYALPLDGSCWTIVGPTANFSLSGFTNGWPGRTLILSNPTGYTMTLLPENASSTATNRIKADNGTNVTVNTSGAVQLIYINDRWQVVGQG